MKNLSYLSTWRGSLREKKLKDDKPGTFCTFRNRIPRGHHTQGVGASGKIIYAKLHKWTEKLYRGKALDFVFEVINGLLLVDCLSIPHNLTQYLLMPYLRVIAGYSSLGITSWSHYYFSFNYEIMITLYFLVNTKYETFSRVYVVLFVCGGMYVAWSKMVTVLLTAMNPPSQLNNEINHLLY